MLFLASRVAFACSRAVAQETACTVGSKRSRVRPQTEIYILTRLVDHYHMSTCLYHPDVVRTCQTTTLAPIYLESVWIVRLPLVELPFAALLREIMGQTYLQFAIKFADFG